MAEKRTRSTYHHGDLRAALIAAGITLARDGGPDAVVLREVARAVGVAPNSAYGHFATLTALKKAVAQTARADMAEAMSLRLAARTTTDSTDPQDAARAYLRDVGRAYVHFALTEPGLFRTAMGGDPTGIRVPGGPDRNRADDDDPRPKPKAMLEKALTGLIDAGCLRPADVGRAVMASWATVHGLSIMLLDLLPQLTDGARDAAIDGALDVLLAGLTGGRA
ncbi:TetR/AcrR family transcriptional regulator [Catenuloplanes japonicus]|uniref:TetR/AcrR family transcriptional regulator n=1 Tax=Catenuloplanes japonicus TaxID=33876 RepID=UPI000525E382|nr:TetR/AcrR family transcriptional regulator [Catenuloplanes japonicus]